MHCCDCHNYNHVQSSEEEEVSRCCKKQLCDRRRSWFLNPNRHFPSLFSVMKSRSRSLSLSLTTISKDLKESCVFFRTHCFYNQISVEIVCNPFSSLSVTLADNDSCSVTTDPESAEKNFLEEGRTVYQGKRIFSSGSLFAIFFKVFHLVPILIL